MKRSKSIRNVAWCGLLVVAALSAGCQNGVSKVSKQPAPVGRNAATPTLNVGQGGLPPDPLAK